jgi:hypothetical protein
LRVTSKPNDFLRAIGEVPPDEREPSAPGAQAGPSKVAARR